MNKNLDLTERSKKIQFNIPNTGGEEKNQSKIYHHLSFKPQFYTKTTELHVYAYIHT